MTNAPPPPVFARYFARALALALIVLAVAGSMSLCRKTDDDSRSRGVRAVCLALREQHGEAQSLAREALRLHPGPYSSLTWRAVEALAGDAPGLKAALLSPESASDHQGVPGFTPEGLRWLRAQLATVPPDCSLSGAPTNR